MEIRDVVTRLVETPEPHKGGMNFLFMKVTTADGIVGCGECPRIEYRARTIVRLIEELKEGFVVGASPHDVESLRHRLYRSNHSLNVPGPLQDQAITSIEMAWWDVVGKAAGGPMYNLLGGKINDPVRTYAYLHYRWTPPKRPSRRPQSTSTSGSLESNSTPSRRSRGRKTSQ